MSRGRNLAGLRDYPALVTLHEKHETRHFVVHSDADIQALTAVIFTERDAQRWYPSVESAERGLNLAESMLRLREAALASAERLLPPRDEGSARFDWQEVEREVERAREALQQAGAWSAKAQMAALARTIIAAGDLDSLGVEVWPWLQAQRGEYERITVETLRPIPEFSVPTERPPETA